MTIAEAAALLHVSTKTVRRMLIDGRLPGIKITSRAWRVLPLDEYLARAGNQR